MSNQGSVLGGSLSLYLYNVLISNSTEVSWVNQANSTPLMFVSSQKHDQTNGNQRWWNPYGTGSIDTSIYNNASPSLRITPSSSTIKMASAPMNYGFKAAVASGATITPTVYVRKSVVGDGTAYNGNQPRLIVRKNAAAGISSDTVLATYASSGGSWNALSGATAAVTDDAVLEFIVDCDGTTGWINIDDFSTDTNTDTKGFKYWFNGVPNVVGNNNAAGGGGSGMLFIPCLQGL